MDFKAESARKLWLNSIDNCLVVNLISDTNIRWLRAVKPLIIEKASNTQPRGVIIDFNALNIIDRYEFHEIVQIYKTICLLGMQCLIVGLKPGVVAALMEFDVETDELNTFLNIDDGLNFMRINHEDHEG